MKTKRIFFQWAVWGMVLVFAVGGQAVTEQEIQKIQEAMPNKPVVQQSKPRTMLVFSLCNGFKHGCIPYWTKALEIMGQKTGAFRVVHSEDMSVFSADSLKQFDVICFNNTTKLTPDDMQQKAIMDFIKSGKGIIGIHAATDNFYGWPEGAMMMGGVFKGHPWLSNGTWAVKIDEPDHPLMKPFAGKGFKINDEIYRTSPPQYSRVNQRVLMSLDMSDPTTKNAKGVTPDDMDTGISWIKSVGKGRLFYCSLGHNNHLTWNAPVLEHYLAGIQYAMGDLKVDDTPLVKFTDTLDPLIVQLRQYDWDKSRAAPAQLHALIGEQYGNPEALKAIEAKLLGVLDSNVSMAVKDFICRELAVIGTEQSLPVLAKMLADEKTTNIARYALENIPGNAVDKVLIQTLAKTESKEIKIGIITTLGVRKCEDAIPPLAKSAQDKDSDIAKSAVRSLGYIGTENAADELDALMLTAPEALKPCLRDALLSCADSLKSTASGKKAQKIYRDICNSKSDSLIRAAGLMGLVELNVPDAGKLLQDSVVSDDIVIQRAAIQMLADFDDERILKAVAADISDLPDLAKVQLMAALAENPKKTGTKQVIQQMGSTNKSVRVAACQALGKLGGLDAVEILAEAAANAQDRQEREAAQTALYQLSGKEVDGAVLRKIAAADKTALDEKITAELIRATVQRQISEAPEVLFRTAMSDNARIASESVRALQSLAGPEYMEEWVDLLVARPNTNTENALVVAAEKIPQRDSRAELILDKYASIQDVNAKISMLRVLGKIGASHAIVLLKKEAASSDAKIGQAAFRAMTDWPGSDFLNEMKDLAKVGKDEKTRILAFRAYVRMLANPGDMSESEVVEKLIAAYPMAQRPNEQKIVIGVLGHYGNSRALAFVKGTAADSALKAESEVSLIQICEKLLKRNPSAVKPVLQNLKDTSTNKSVKKKAEELFEKIHDRDSYVLDWQVSGPYMSKGKNGDALFDVEFVPEKNLSEGNWQDAQSLLEGAVGVFNLSRLSEGDNRAAYLKTILSVDKVTPVVFKIGSDDGVKVWVNGKQVHANNASRPVKAGQDKVDVRLEKGQNQVLVKVTQKSGNWGFCMNITDSNGNAIVELDVNAGN
jgi:type 1 glutamine amidotransferase